MSLAYTLILSGANITDQHNWTNTYTASIYADGDLNLVLQGTSRVTNTDTSGVVHNHGVYVDGYCFYPI